MTVDVRHAAHPADEVDILAVVDAAFADESRDASEELGIVRTTWASCDEASCIELVAVDDSVVVAHLIAAPGRLDGTDVAVAGVAPVCVAPTHQGRGIGSVIMRALVTEAESRGWPLLVLLGDPAYYGRFGFEPAAPLGLTYAPAGTDSPHFQARRLGTYDASLRGSFTYCWESG